MKNKMKEVDVSASIEMVIDSSIGCQLSKFDCGYEVLVSEVYRDHKFEGTVLYVPGVSYKTLCEK